MGCGVCCAREDAGDGLQCAGRPGGHVRALRRDAADQVVHAGLQHICMQVGWLGDGRLARLVGRSVRLFRFSVQHAVAAFLVAASDGESKAFLERDVTPWRAACSFLRLSRVSSVSSLLSYPAWVR